MTDHVYLHKMIQYNLVFRLVMKFPSNSCLHFIIDQTHYLHSEIVFVENIMNF